MFLPWNIRQGSTTGSLWLHFPASWWDPQTAPLLHKWRRFTSLTWNGNRFHPVSKWNTWLNPGEGDSHSHFDYYLLLLASSKAEWFVSMHSVQLQGKKTLCYNVYEISQHFCPTSPFSKQTVGWKGVMLLFFTHKTLAVKGKLYFP